MRAGEGREVAVRVKMKKEVGSAGREVYEICLADV